MSGHGRIWPSRTGGSSGAPTSSPPPEGRHRQQDQLAVCLGRLRASLFKHLAEDRRSLATSTARSSPAVPEEIPFDSEIEFNDEEAEAIEQQATREAIVDRMDDLTDVELRTPEIRPDVDYIDQKAGITEEECVHTSLDLAEQPRSSSHIDVPDRCYDNKLRKRMKISHEQML